MAYGARLESVLGASPRGFESPILRSEGPGIATIPGPSTFFTSIFTSIARHPAVTTG